MAARIPRPSLSLEIAAGNVALNGVGSGENDGHIVRTYPVTTDDPDKDPRAINQKDGNSARITPPTPDNISGSVVPQESFALIDEGGHVWANVRKGRDYDLVQLNLKDPKQGALLKGIHNLSINSLQVDSGKDAFVTQDTVDALNQINRYNPGLAAAGALAVHVDLQPLQHAALKSTAAPV